MNNSYSKVTHRVVSELDKALRTVEDLGQTLQRVLPIVKEDLEEKQRLVTRYLTPEAVSDTNVTPSNIKRCRDVKMEAHSITINIGHQLAELQVITDTNVKEAVTEALVAKVTWEDDRETELRELSERHTEEMRRVEGELEEERRRGEAALEEGRRAEETARQVTQTLQTQLSEAEARGRMDKKDREKLEQRVQQMQEEQRAAEERVATLRGKLRQEKTKGDKRVAAITRRYEEQKKRVEEQVMTFVIQLEIQTVLSDLIPEDARQDVTWTEVMQYGPSDEDIDLRIGQPLLVPDTSAGQWRRKMFRAGGAQLAIDGAERLAEGAKRRAI
nr:hypothetical protein BaRGS_015233 [Batillaria attramentaria]